MIALSYASLILSYVNFKCASAWSQRLTNKRNGGFCTSTLVHNSIPNQPSHNARVLDSKTFATKEQRDEASVGNLDLKFFNSLTRQKDLFVPLVPNKVSMYTCGPTVYDHAHVGNFRAFLTYDLIKRVLLYFGFEVDHVCNLTDVDDKIIKRCTQENVSLDELTRRYEALFMEDLKALNIIPARIYPKATENIPEMVQLIKDLEKNGLAYQSSEGSWYFNVGKKDGYGQQLVSLDVEGMQIGTSSAGQQRGTDADEYDAEKHGARDFALWKSFKPDFDREDAVWDTEIGLGRPGWHLECSAMAKKFLGDTIDIHCGGIDLKFPHHENEIAQSEGATGKNFCNCWMHNGFVNIGDEKMSKSKGNFLTLRTACPKSDDVRAYRYLVISSQYRQSLTLSAEAMSAAKGAVNRIDRLMSKLDDHLAGFAVDKSGNHSSPIADEADRALKNFELALLDDLSMPRAAAALFSVIKAAEKEIKRISKDGEESDLINLHEMDRVGLYAVKDTLLRMDEVFGIFYKVPHVESQIQDSDEKMANSIPEDVLQLVKQRAQAKETMDWELADTLRKRISDLGFSVKDIKGGEPLISRIE